MKASRVFSALAVFAVLTLTSLNNTVLARKSQAPLYYPTAQEWQRVTPESQGIDPDKLAAAIEFAQNQAIVEPRDLSAVLIESWSKREPNFKLYGPTKPRGDSNGLVIKGGYIVGSWGDANQVDMTFSVAKSYLSTVAAMAIKEGLIKDVQQPLHHSAVGHYFQSEHNRAITWHHLLNQTSDWSGTLWEVPDWADRPEGDDPEKWPNRAMHQPGSHYKYNDVRVNMLAYALLETWRKPLPQVLKEKVMDRIGASTTWRWHGYDNSWVTIDGLRMQSVSGGGHFGGGMFINSMDHARFGLLFLRNGYWNGEQIIPRDWITQMRAPTPARDDYGYMWWLNTDKKRISNAPESAYFAAGFGGNYIYIDPENDLVVVMRWVPEFGPVMEKFLDALAS